MASFNSTSGGPAAVSDYLRQLYDKNMNVQQIFLDFRAITDLLPYIHLLTSFKRLKKLSLHGNRLTQLPTDLSMFRTLQILDLSNNLLDDNVQMATLSLKTLPSLKNLIYPVPKEKQKKIVQQLKKLEYFNNIKIQRLIAKKNFVFNLLNKKTMQEYQTKLCQLYKSLMEFQKKYLDQKQPQSIQRFKQDIHAISNDFIMKLDQYKQQATPSLQYVMLYMAKYQMFQPIKTRTFNICQDIYGDLGDFIFKISQQQDQIFKSIAEKSLNLTSLENQIKEKQEQQKIQSQNNGDYHILNKNLLMQKEIKRLKKQKEQLSIEMSQIEIQNKKMIQSLAKYAKGDKTVLGNFNAQFTKQNRSRADEQPSARSQQQMTSTNRILPLPNPNTTLRSNEKPTHRHQGNRDTQNYNTSGNRNLTLKQLKDIIEQIYQSKLKFDQKNYDGKIARQTMHQYLFTYLNQKYGLKNLTIQAAASIVSGIQAYSSQDNDVCVFGKILRNQVDQEFRFVQTQLKTTVTDLLKMHIKTKMPYKSANQINDLLQDKMNGQIIWEEAQDIVKYLYNKEDSEAIIKKLNILFKINEKSHQNRTANRRLTREEQAVMMGQKQIRKLKFSLFLKCVLDFQLKNHEKLLKPLVHSFKIRDTDTDGIINEQEFINVIQDLCSEQNDIIPYLLNIVDPYEIKQITFTQMVRLVANYPESSPILSRFIGKQNQNEEYGENQETQNFQSQQFRTYN